MFVPIITLCHSFTYIHVVHKMILQCIHDDLMYDSTALQGILVLEMLSIWKPFHFLLLYKILEISHS
jgi:hypothetical protein